MFKVVSNGESIAENISDIEEAVAIQKACGGTIIAQGVVSWNVRFECHGLCGCHSSDCKQATTVRFRFKPGDRVTPPRDSRITGWVDTELCEPCFEQDSLAIK